MATVEPILQFSNIQKRESPLEAAEWKALLRRLGDDCEYSIQNIIRRIESFY